MQMEHARAASISPKLVELPSVAVQTPISSSTTSTATTTAATTTRQQVLTPTLSNFARLKFWNACKMPCRVITTLVFDLKSYGCHHVPERGGALRLLRGNLPPSTLWLQPYSCFISCHSN